uniref:hypothetical protein n=1 Tax=Agathobacter sp. TaxID=2021311 RepID=UPI004057C055
MNEIRLTEINVSKNKVIYNYIVNGDWAVYFNTKISMEIEYSVNIEEVPKSVLAVPFVSNILPIVWLCDARLYLDEIDRDFIDNLDLVKKGYQDMYPMLPFKGSIEVCKVKENGLATQNSTAVFFSGGVDAYTTLLRHIDEKPYLVTLWGADVKLDDIEGWNNVERHIHTVSKEYNLEKIVVKTNFRSVINEGKLDVLVKDSKDMWWHGFQHGIALIGHMAPLAFLLGIKYTYIASSNPQSMKGQYTCASDPTIDNYVMYSGCKTVHDGYEWDRQNKIQFLVSKKQKGNPITLRVCWISTGGKNCCRCEKCYRTILEIVSEAGNPNEYGFKWDNEAIKACKRDMLHKITLQDFIINQYYYPIQDSLIRNKNKIADYEKYEWFTRLDYTRFNDYPIKVFRRTLLWRGVSKIYRKIIRR